MRILHVIDTLGVGGAERMLVTLLPELARGGAEVAVAALRPPLDLRASLESAGIDVHVQPARNKWNLTAGARAIAETARRTDSRIIHAHLLFPAIYTGLARMLRFTGARTCVTYHNLAYAPGCNEPGLSLSTRKLLNRIVSRYGMDKRFAVSRAVSAHYHDALNPGEIDVVPVPIPLADIDAAVAGLPENGRADPRCPRLVLPGRLVHEKGHAVLLRAMARLRDRNIQCSAVLAGAGPLRAPLEDQVHEAGLDGAVHFTGQLAHDELMRTVARADIVVVPSLFEGFGTTAAEAMALGRPVVATRAGGLTDVVEDGKSGLLVDVGDDDALAAAIERLCNAPALRARMGAAGRARVARLFDAKQVAARLMSLYSELPGETP